MFGMENEENEGQEQDPKSQVLQEILEFAQSKMLGKMKGKAPEGMEVSIESVDTESPEGMEADEATEGAGPMCPHCGKSIKGC
jgi:hypothetical protein